jgi:2-oxoglutarate dehydrogenase E1 component
MPTWTSQFNISNTYFGTENASLRDLLNALRDTYCRSVGVEFMYISDPAEKRWMQQRLESIRSTPNFTPEKKKSILDRLTAAEGWNVIFILTLVRNVFSRGWRKFHCFDG